MSLYHPVKIGNVELKGNLFLAPVAGYSDSAFRSVCIENGACFTYTEMVSAEALVRKNLKTEIDGLYVSDASVIPVSPGKPPILLILALASRLANHLKEEVIN